MNKRKTALVTGASRGIGRGIVLELASRGYNIAGTGLRFDPEDREKGLFKVKKEVEEKGCDFLPLQADLADLSRHEYVFRAVWDNFSRLDVVVNNAGIAPEERKDILEAAPESFDRLLSVNLRGPFFFSQKAVAYLFRTKEIHPESHPCLVFITSVSAEVSSLNRAEYCISKSGLSQAARIFAHRLAGEGINVYEVRPGVILTDMTEPVKKKYDIMIEEGGIPQNRWGFPEDVGKTVGALAEGMLEYSTGQIIEVSGGMNLRRL